jgi:hypothetical protein
VPYLNLWSKLRTENGLFQDHSSFIREDYDFTDAKIRTNFPLDKIMMLDASVLVSLAEVSVTVAGFTGVVVVIGSRSAGKWTSVDDVRFWSLMLNSLTPIALSLLPLLFGPDSYKLLGLVVGGTWFVLLMKQAFSAWNLPGASKRLVMIVTLGSLTVYGAFLTKAAGFTEVPIIQYYLAIILWNITMAFVFFVRLLRGSRVAA